MRDQSKTKQVLIQELASLRQRIAELEQSESEHKNVEEALRESDNQFRVAQELSPDGFTILRPIRDAQERVVDFTWVYENATIARLNGTDPKAVVGRRLLELFPGHSGSQFLRAYQLVAESGEHCVFEADYCGESMSNPTWFRIAVVPMGGDIAILAQDITERKQAEEALRESEEKYRLIFQSEPSALFLTELGEKGTVIDANEAALRMYGYSLDEMRRMRITEFSNEPEQTIRSAVLPIGSVLAIPLRWHRKKDGTVFPVEISGSVFELNGRGMILAVHRDITDRKRAEDALRESDERYKALFDRSLDLVYITDLEGRFIDANDAALNRLGYKREEIHSLNFASLLSEDQLPLAFKTVQEIRETGIHKSLVEFRLRHKDGSHVLYVETQGSAVLSNGAPVAIQAIARDTTDRKLAEEALKYAHDQLRALAIRLEEAREETRTTISQDLHDDVGGNLAGLKMDLIKLDGIASKVSDVEQRNSLMEVSLQSRELINKTILSARRIMMELRPSVLDDFGLVAALEWQAGEFNTHTSISCQVIAEQEVLDLEKKTATTVFRIFQEALANVARHSGATEVIIRLSSDKELLVLEVIDNGRGITEEQFLGKESLGLMGMRERALALEGTIQVRGESGKGTTVTLRVPMR
jgi:two-component system sensor histidine kinase UhpB